MTTARYMPHRVLGDHLIITPESTIGELPLSPTGEVLAYQLEDDPLRLRWRVSDWRGDIPDVLPEVERATPPVRALHVVRADPSRRRFAVDLDELERVLEFDRRQWSGPVSVQAVVVRGQDSAPAGDGLATDRGALLAWSRPVIIHFDEPPRPPGDHLEVRWEDFRSSTNPVRHRHSDNIFALDLLSSERPIIWLNSGRPNLRTVLNNGATRGRYARIRDATNFMIAHQVWTSLIASAMQSFADIQRSTPDRAMSELVGEIPEWERRVLEDWARYLYADLNAEEASDRMLSASTNAAGVQDVMVRLPNAIQTRFNTMNGFAGLVRDSGQFVDK